MKNVHMNTAATAPVTVWGIAAFKSWRDHDGNAGGAFQGNLTMNGKSVGCFTDDGWGGEMDIAFGKVNAHAEAAFAAHAASTGETIASAICILVDEYETNKRLKRWCKTKTVFQLKGDAEGEYRTFDRPFSPAMKAMMVAKYGDSIQTIYNETVGA